MVFGCMWNKPPRINFINLIASVFINWKGSQNHYISKVYTLPDEKNFVRYCHKPFSNFPLKQDQLILKEGCTVYLEKIGEFHFKGSTKNNNCESKLRGASSVRSEVEITKEGLKTLDRGFTKMVCRFGDPKMAFIYS